MSLLEEACLDKSAFDVVSLQEADNDEVFWRTTTPEQRMEALELMRQVIYGYDPATTRLQRVLEVVELERS